MANARKALKRSRRALKAFSESTADRADDVLKNGINTSPQQLRNHIINQITDSISAWVDLVSAFSEQPPTVVIEAPIGGLANGTVISPQATVDLDASVTNINNLAATPLTCPGIANPLVVAMPLDQIPLPPPILPEIDTIRITVPVTVAPNISGLYSGFILVGQAIQVRLHVWVHT